MRADVFIDKTEGEGVEISVVKHGLTSGAAHKYDTLEKARVVLVTFGLDTDLIDCQLRTLSKMPPSVLLRFPTADIADDVLRSLRFTAAAFQAAQIAEHGQFIAFWLLRRPALPTALEVDTGGMCPACLHHWTSTVLFLCPLVAAFEMQEKKEKQMDLCELAADEQNPNKLLALITQINALLAAKQERLKGRVSAFDLPPKPTD